jgi:uncharacterized protein (DUF2336 family)
MTAQQSLISDLEEAMSCGLTSRRTEILRRVIDLFVNGAVYFSEEQVNLFDDVIAQLSDRIEIAARTELAERLAPIANAPPIIIRKLAFDDEVAVAAPVLTHSARLDDEALVENAKTKGQGHLMAISRRQSVSAAVTDVIVVRGDRDVARCVAGNSGAEFSASGYSTLVKRSEGDDAFCECVGSRPDLPRNLYLQLLAKASDSVRKKLQAMHLYASKEIQQVIESVADRMAATAALASRNYVAAQSLVESLHAAGVLGEANLLDFAQANKFEEATATLARLCNVPTEFAERAMLQARPESVLILNKAAGHSWTAVKALLELRAKSCGIMSDDLDECLTSFEGLKRSTAEKVIQLQRLNQKVRAPVDPSYSFNSRITRGRST